MNQRMDQLNEEHRYLTLAQARPTATEKQRQTWETECRKIETKLALLEKYLVPLEEKKAELEQAYQELLDRYDEAVKALKKGENRAKGAALARVYSKVLLTFKKVNEGYKGRGRHGRMIDEWEPDKTVFVYVEDCGFESIVDAMGLDDHQMEILEKMLENKRSNSAQPPRR